MMDSLLPLIAVIGPLALIVAALLPAHTGAGMGRRAATASLVALAAAATCLLGWFAAGPRPAATWASLAYLDTLSAIMLLLVSFVGTIVVRYSGNYLDGDPGQARFFRWLCLALAAVQILVIAGNLVLFLLAWIATSKALHHLLVFYPERPAARLAAGKKFVVSRLGDLCLIAAAALLWGAFGTLDLAPILAATKAGEAPADLPWIALLLVAGALLKSAQFPFHGWLLEVMETPTPVSALLHAGIINAGGFLVLRFADLIALSTPALDTLAIVGGITALFGSVVMLTQTSVKVQLAYSTIAQMGFMLLQCGLGAFSAALLHIVAHSLYKAHAFLPSGSVIDLARASWSPSPGGQPHPARMAMALGGVFVVALLVGTVMGAGVVERPGVFALGVIMLFGLTHLIAQAIDERPSRYVIGRTALAALLVAVAYFGLQRGMELVVAGSLPPTEALRGPVDLAIVAGAMLAFAALTMFQGRLTGSTDGRGLALYVHVANGLYVNTLANRLVLWLRAARPATAERA